QLREQVRDVPIEIRPLPNVGDEDDPDACFAHFNVILEEVRAGGVPADDIIVDFTRGTKVMSAALVLAAVRQEVPRLRYISGPLGFGLCGLGPARLPGGLRGCLGRTPCGSRLESLCPRAGHAGLGRPPG